MSDAEISVSWRAALVPANSEQAVYGYLSRIGKERVVLRMDRNFPPGRRCNLSVMLPRRRPDEAAQVIKVQGVVAVSVLSAGDFQVILKSLEIQGNGQSLLDEQIRKYNEVWRGS